MQSYKDLEMRILRTVFEALRLLGKLLSNIPRWLIDLFIFHLLIVSTLSDGG